MSGPVGTCESLCSKLLLSICRLCVSPICALCFDFSSCLVCRLMEACGYVHLVQYGIGKLLHLVTGAVHHCIVPWAAYPLQPPIAAARLACGMHQHAMRSEALSSPAPTSGNIPCHGQSRARSNNNATNGSQAPVTLCSSSIA